MSESKAVTVTLGKKVIWQLFLILLPWVIFYFWIEQSFYFYFLNLFLNPATQKISPFLILAPFEIFLLVGIIIAWKRKFPVWSYTWIGILYFFLYREIFEMVIRYSSLSMPVKYAQISQTGFYFIINPIALALLLAFITRKDWLLAGLTGYPYTSIIMAWYTLDTTPLFILAISFILYGVFAFLYLTLSSPIFKFISLLVGTLVISIGFFLYTKEATGLSLLFIITRNVLILLFPLLINQIPIYHKIFKTTR